MKQIVSHVINRLFPVAHGRFDVVKYLDAVKYLLHVKYRNRVGVAYMRHIMAR